MTAIVTRSDAANLQLPDETVDLIVTSPPYWSLRSYQDEGQHYSGQLGDEATPGEYVDNLIACTREWMRVLKPGGSLFLNMGDKYSTGSSGDRNTGFNERSGNAPGKRSQERSQTKSAAVVGMQSKSLIGLPWRYAIRCIDELGLILRAEIVWAKPNGLPESVTDRVRRSHEQVFHFVKQPRYYSAVDEVREPHAPWTLKAYAYEQKNGGYNRRKNPNRVDEGDASDYAVANPLGKLPGSVWTIPTSPLKVPASLGIDHFAAYPPELVRRIVLGWSPREVCTACGEGRRPVRDGAWRYEAPGNVNAERALERANALGLTAADVAERYGTKIKVGGNHADGESTVHSRALSLAPLLGGRLYAEQLLPLVKRAPGGYTCACQDTTAPATPGVVLDPFGGTGTTALAASAFGRVGISVDLSADYCRLARWRTTDPGERARVLGVDKPPVQVDGQQDLFGELTA